MTKFKLIINQSSGNCQKRNNTWCFIVIWSDFEKKKTVAIRNRLGCIATDKQYSFSKPPKKKKIIII